MLRHFILYSNITVYISLRGVVNAGDRIWYSDYSKLLPILNSKSKLCEQK